MKWQLPTVAVLLVASLVLAGCTVSTRDIDQEAADRAKWAQKNNRHDVVAVLSGPERIEPGALVWFSAYGSHDPDFLGATTRDLYGNESTQGGVLYTDEGAGIQFNWYVDLAERRNEGLGTGIRVYEWQVDDGPVLRSYDLTHRYGSEDGPIRFPVGFSAPGEHSVRLTVTGWDGSRDSQLATVTVAAGGIGSTVDGWVVTDAGWTQERTVDISFDQYGECMPSLQSAYDEATHRVRAPWDLVYFMQNVIVNATWPHTTDALPLPDLPGLPALNTNQVDVTLGHCGRDGAWARFAGDQDVVGGDLRLTGDVGGGEFAGKLEVEGRRTEKTGLWDFNAYMSDSGQFQGGTGTTVTVQFIFVPAVDTSAGGL